MRYVKELNNGRLQIKGITFWKALGLSFLFDLILVLLSSSMDIFYTSYKFLFQGSDNSLYIISTIVDCIYQYGIALIIILFINKSMKLSMEVDERIKIRKRDYFLSAALIISYILITYGWFDYILFSIPSETLESVGEYLSSLPIFIILIQSCLIAPFFEEILYRGILLNGLLKKYSYKKAILYSAIIFGVAHLNIPQGINAFLLGLILGIVFYYTKSIYICMFMHFTNNFLINFVVYPTTVFWTVVLFISIPVIGLLLMLIAWKKLNFKARKIEALDILNIEN